MRDRIANAPGPGGDGHLSTMTPARQSPHARLPEAPRRHAVCRGQPPRTLSLAATFRANQGATHVEGLRLFEGQRARAREHARPSRAVGARGDADALRDRRHGPSGARPEQRRLSPPQPVRADPRHRRRRRGAVGVGGDPDLSGEEGRQADPARPGRRGAGGALVLRRHEHGRAAAPDASAHGLRGEERRAREVPRVHGRLGEPPPRQPGALARRPRVHRDRVLHRGGHPDGARARRDQDKSFIEPYARVASYREKCFARPAWKRAIESYCARVEAG